ncbi:hypothetical protein SJS82_21790, partial [Aeromonas media]
VADGDHHEHQQVGGEAGHQPDDRGMEKRERLGWLAPLMEKGANGSLFVCVDASYTAASASVAAAALDQVADCHYHEHQQVGGEAGHQPDDRGMEKRERLG